MSPIVQEVLVSVAKTFGVMLIGAGYRRSWSGDVRPLTDLAMSLFVPCLAFSAIIQAPVSIEELGLVVSAAVLILGIVLVFAAIVLRLLGINERPLYLPIVFMNSANLPFPILEANYGWRGLGFGVIFYMVAQTFLFSLGVLLLQERPSLKTLATTPVFIATILGMSIKLSGWTPPALAMELTSLVGQAAIPIILFTFGHSLGRVRLGMWRRTIVGSVLRLAGGLAAGLITVRLLGIEGVLHDVVILVSTMPSAVVTVVLARKAGVDHEVIAAIVFATTAASVVILPVLLIWLRT